MALVFVFSSLPQIPSPPGPLSYYHVHIVEYAVLGSLIVHAMTHDGTRRPAWRVVAMAFAVSTGYGVSDEIHQVFVPGRTFEMLDIAADAIGSLIGAIGMQAWGIIRRR